MIAAMSELPNCAFISRFVILLTFHPSSSVKRLYTPSIHQSHPRRPLFEACLVDVSSRSVIHVSRPCDSHQRSILIEQAMLEAMVNRFFLDSDHFVSSDTLSKTALSI
jgi:hypothetical protein